jgi:hypothetical protein
VTTDFSYADVEWALTASDADLFARAGSILLGSGLGVGSGDPGHNRDFFRDWWDARMDAIRSVVCTQSVVRGLGGDMNDDIVTLVPIVLDSVDGHVQAAVIVAAIIVRRGITSFCDLAD